jgi:hypothetical protein
MRFKMFNDSGSGHRRWRGTWMWILKWKRWQLAVHTSPPALFALPQFTSARVGILCSNKKCTRRRSWLIFFYVKLFMFYLEANTILSIINCLFKNLNLVYCRHKCGKEANLRSTVHVANPKMAEVKIIGFGFNSRKQRVRTSATKPKPELQGAS